MNATAIRIVSIVFGLASTVIIVLNLLTDRSCFWAIWPIWAFSMLAGDAIGAIRFHPNWLLGIWLGGGFLVIAGIVAIDISDGRNWWAFCPAGAWVLLSALFIGLTVDLLALIPTHPPRENLDRPLSEGTTRVSSRPGRRPLVGKTACRPSYRRAPW